jgi:hypothetical protein
MFAFRDGIQGKIRAVLLRAVFDTGRAVDVEDLQVFPGGDKGDAVPIPPDCTNLRQ